MRLSEKIVIHRIGVYRALSAPRLRDCEFMPEPVGEPRNDLVLHVEEIGDQLIEAGDVPGNVENGGAALLALSG